MMVVVEVVISDNSCVSGDSDGNDDNYSNGDACGCTVAVCDDIGYSMVVVIVVV